MGVINRRRAKAISRGRANMNRANLHTIPDEDRIHHKVERVFVGHPDYRPRFVCMTEGCSRDTLERSSSMNEKEWQELLKEFQKKHPYIEVRDKGYIVEGPV